MASEESGGGDSTTRVQQFIEGWEAHLPESDLSNEKRNNLASFITPNSTISTAMVEELEVVCGASTLTCEGEEEVDIQDFLRKVPVGIPLTTTGLQEQELKKRAKNAHHKAAVAEKLKYKANNAPWAHERLSEATPANQAISPQALLTVNIYKPFVKPKPKLRLLHEYHVLSCQKLTELRDNIVCVADSMVTGEFSKTPEQKTDIKAKDLFKSGFFFIEGVFYNDMRTVICRDYSQVIVNWAKKSKVTASYRREKMEDTRFADLTLCLGQPYLYLHQGSCEHLLVFTDMRMLHSGDCQDVDQYPIATVTRTHKRYNCRVCHLHSAKWVTRQSPLAPEDPCYFCNSCFRSLHYDEQGNKLGEFKAYALPQ